MYQRFFFYIQEHFHNISERNVFVTCTDSGRPFEASASHRPCSNLHTIFADTFPAYSCILKSNFILFCWMSVTRCSGVILCDDNSFIWRQPHILKIRLIEYCKLVVTLLSYVKLGNCREFPFRLLGWYSFDKKALGKGYKNGSVTFFSIDYMDRLFTEDIQCV